MAGVERIRLSELFIKSGAIMYLLDFESLRIIDANPAAQRFYGYSREEFLTKKITDLNILPQAEIKANLRKIIRNETSFYRFQHRISDGRLRHLEIHATPLLQEKRTEGHFFLGPRRNRPDPSRKSAQGKRTKVQDHGRCFPIPLSIMAPGGENLYLNREFAKTFGYTHEELGTPETWFERSYPDPELRRRYLAEFRNGRTAAALRLAGRGWPPPRTAPSEG